MRICFVCLGNICRSPIAEVIFRKKAREKGFENWVIESRGTNRYHKGGPADERAVKVCTLRGVDLTKHVATRLKTEDFRKYDVILSMASDVREEMEPFAKDPVADFQKVRNFLDILPGHEGEDVPDPWYGGEEGFHEAYELIERACEAWISELAKRQ